MAPEKAARIVEEALKLGIRHIDTQMSAQNQAEGIFFSKLRKSKAYFLKLENRKLELNTPSIIFSSRNRDRAGACGGSAQARGFVRHHKTTAGTPRPCRER